MLKIGHGGGYKRNSLKGFIAFVLGIITLSSTVFFSTVLAESSSTDLQVTITPVISIRVAKDYNDGNGLVDINALGLNVTPTNTGAFVKDNLSVLVSTSNPTGYTLTMANNDDDTSMHNTNTTITTTIPSITADASESTFSLNSWAYSLGDITDPDQTFSPIPTSTSSSTIKTIDSPIVEDQTDITFAAKIDTSIPAGTYQDTVVFTATTNYVLRGLETITNMQDMTPQVCVESSIGAEATLTDTRDGKTYTVAKLADGRCWMTQNLHLVGPRTLTPADSNVAADFALPASSTSFGTTDNAAGINIPRLNDTGRADYGAYYNWYTATASTGTYSMASGNTIASICPKGWRLPTGGNGGEFQALYDAYGSHADFISNTSAVLSGYWGDSSDVYQGSSGYWWSSTAVSDVHGDNLSFNSSYVSPQGSGSKRSGVSVRCIAEQENLTTISTMQQMTSDICVATPTPATSATTVPQATLRDVRDGNTYVVRKLADGNCWMSQNLRLGKIGEDINLTPADSDVSVDTTIPSSQIQNADGVNWNQNDTYHIYDRSSDITNGNLYNWYTATASTGTAAMVNQDAPSSVCPKGWKLPEGSGESSFRNLITTYGATMFTRVQAAPLDFTTNGAYQYERYRIEATAEVGHYWSSSATTNAVQTYALTFHVGSVNQQYGYDKPYGFAVRCVAR